ncbi:MAG: DsrE family protein [Aquincola sp.]|nr:DsrE family protein [Aquincola sp.]MDH5331012.1 DsrE family protein [Aquincola sp.]
MKRRIALLSAAGAAVVATEAAQAQAASGAGMERVVIQVSTPEQKLWNQAINYIENLRELYGPDKVEIELVALGHGIGVLKLDSTQGPRVADAVKAGVHISACQVTMRRQKLKPEDMLPNIGYVPAGLGQIIKRQREGWSYISG